MYKRQLLYVAKGAGHFFRPREERVKQGSVVVYPPGAVSYTHLDVYKSQGYKLLSLIIASLLLSVTFHTRLNLLVCGTSLLAAYLTPGVNRKRLSLTLIPFVLTAVSYTHLDVYKRQG